MAFVFVVVVVVVVACRERDRVRYIDKEREGERGPKTDYPLILKDQDPKNKQDTNAIQHHIRQDRTKQDKT
jgi:hypothetical protein